ncbi:molybdenum cofactor guanylyltransferase [Parasphingopyxis marina]|uniref:Molybdenum cofactor guanylyltransferase n=1 Tax=Parasphingopyxis marina TaxID=2761622 RepID=A0A842I021_9SPHN|nr:molybdenum cofactor guanylyltransferase [Parasphingopyxis marina]MBC2778572.1 molybdenum cofactor guanylyltransferase [Parasphingopyxis marina]
MTRLGAILAGGKSSRFGSDKAEAMLDGRPLVEHVFAGLRNQCDEIVLCGREREGMTSLPDRPGPDQGPLGGLNAALHHAAERGHDEVLSAACDNAGLPADLADQLSPPPAYADGQPVIGLWPAHLAPLLDDWMARQDNRAMMGWIDACGARSVRLKEKPANINQPEDLTELEDRHGL